MKQIFFVEVTDTFGGEANYCWVHHFKVTATTARGAIRKVRHEVGLPEARHAWSYDDQARYDFKKTAICAFVRHYEDGDEHFARVVSL